MPPQSTAVAAPELDDLNCLDVSDGRDAWGGPDALAAAHDYAAVAEAARRRAAWAVVQGRLSAALGWTRLYRDLADLAAAALPSRSKGERVRHRDQCEKLRIGRARFAPEPNGAPHPTGEATPPSLSLPPSRGLGARLCAIAPAARETGPLNSQGRTHWTHRTSVFDSARPGADLFTPAAAECSDGVVGAELHSLHSLHSVLECSFPSSNLADPGAVPSAWMLSASPRSRPEAFASRPAGAP